MEIQRLYFFGGWGEKDFYWGRMMPKPWPMRKGTGQSMGKKSRWKRVNHEKKTKQRGERKLLCDSLKKPSS